MHSTCLYNLLDGIVVVNGWGELSTNMCYYLVTIPSVFLSRPVDTGVGLGGNDRVSRDRTEKCCVRSTFEF